MLNLSDLLKEGTKHLTGKEEAVLNNINAVHQMAQITRTSLGPNGMNKMVVNHLEKLFVTSDAATILKELDVVHPAAKIAVMASQRQETEIGDGTNLVLVLCGEFLQNAGQLITKGLHPNDVIAGYSKALTKALEILEELVAYKVNDVRSLPEVTKILKPVLASKQYGYEDLLAPLVAQACIQVCPKVPQHFNVDNVRVAKILGGGVLDTSVVKGHVLARDAEGVIKHVKAAKIAVFGQGLDMSKTETKDSVVIRNAEDLLNYNKSEEKAIEKLVKEIFESGANVIVVGGSIGEMALHFLERSKIMIVKCPSKFELRRICKAVGATPLVRLGGPTQEELGRCDLVTVEEIGSTKVTIFRQEAENSGISTIVIRAATSNLIEDFERAIADGVNIYKAMTKDGRFTAGAGATEIELAKRLQAFADATPGLVQYAIKKYGEAFEVIPRTLAENAGLKASEVLPKMYAAHQKGNIHDGLDIEEGSISNAVELGVWDLLATKISALRLSTEAILTVLRVDQIIMAKPAGGPKPPKQGPMDADD